MTSKLGRMARAPGTGRDSTAVAVILTGVFAVAWCGYFAYQRLHGAVRIDRGCLCRRQSCAADAAVSGTVVTIYADDTDLVEAGQALVELDPADRDIRSNRQRRSWRGRARGARASRAGTQLAAEVAVREAELARARSDVHRREGLTARGCTA